MSDTSSLAENSSEEFSDNNDEEYAVEVENFDPQNAVAETKFLFLLLVGYEITHLKTSFWATHFKQRC